MTTTPPLADVPIRSADELTRRWAAVLDPAVFTARSLWLTWLDSDGRMLPVLMPIDGVPELPDDELLDGLRRVHVGVSNQHLSDGGHFALALCRPGRAGVTANDTAWADSLLAALDGTPIPGWSLHVAAAGAVVPVVPSEGRAPSPPPRAAPS
jgi:hypothetical protein